MEGRAKPGYRDGTGGKDAAFYGSHEGRRYKAPTSSGGIESGGAPNSRLTLAGGFVALAP